MFGVRGSGTSGMTMNNGLLLDMSKQEEDIEEEDDKESARSMLS